TKNRLAAHEKSISPVYGLTRAGAIAIPLGGGLAHSPTKFTPPQREHWTDSRLRRGMDAAPLKFRRAKLIPMKTIFDRETEIGHADPERWGWEGGDLPNLELLNGQMMAHTRADLNHKR